MLRCGCNDLRGKSRVVARDGLGSVAVAVKDTILEGRIEVVHGLVQSLGWDVGEQSLDMLLLMSSGGGLSEDEASAGSEAEEKGSGKHLDGNARSAW